MCEYAPQLLEHNLLKEKEKEKSLDESMQVAALAFSVLESMVASVSPPERFRQQVDGLKEIQQVVGNVWSSRRSIFLQVFMRFL